MVLIENPGWPSTKLTVNHWIWDDISPACRQKIFYKNRGVFNYNIPRNVSLKSSSPWGGPIRKETKILEKSEERLKWRAEASIFFYSGQSYKSKGKIYPSSSVILGCHWGTEVERDKELRSVIILGTSSAWKSSAADCCLEWLGDTL